MLRWTRVAVIVLPFSVGCFAQPEQADPAESRGSDTGSTGVSSTATLDTATSSGQAMESTSTSTSTTTDTTSSSAGLSTGKDNGGDTSSGDDGSTSTGQEPGPCDCPDEGLVLCETFDEFGETFPGWEVLAGSVSPAQVDSPCGSAFRGQIVAGESLAALGRSLPEIPAEGEVDAIRVTGRIRVQDQCALFTSHRLLAVRLDLPGAGEIYSAEIALSADGFVFVQRSPAQALETTIIGPTPLGDWQSFELSLLALSSGDSPAARVSVGAETLVTPRTPLPGETLGLTIQPGVFAATARKAGCAAEFDSIAVQFLAAPS